MNRRLIVICAVAFLVALAVPAFAAVQNVKVSGDITASVVSRNHFNLGTALSGTTVNTGSDDSNVLMSQTRLRVDADLTDNVSTTVRLLNERDWGEEAGSLYTGATSGSNSTEIDLDLAYVTLKEMLYSPLTVIIGRQLLHYGNGMIVGDPDTSRQELSNAPQIINRDLSVRRSFDAVRAILNYDPLTIDLVAAKIDEGRKISTANSRDRDDVNLYGAVANYKMGDKYNSMVEGYFFSARDDSTLVALNDASDVVNTPGFRVATNPIKGLMLSLEQAWQFGNKNLAAGSNAHRGAMATQFISSYSVQTEKLLKYAPVVGLGFSRFSGDKNPADGTGAGGGAGAVGNKTYTAWDPLFIDQGVGTIANVLFDKTNCKVLNVNMAANPMEDVNLRLDYTALWLDKKLNTNKMGTSGLDLFTLNQTGGNSFYPIMSDGSQKTLWGYEVDGTLTYDYTEDVQFKLCGGGFFPGSVFNKVNRKAATQVIGSCKVTF
jgi:hypothetical protein